MGKTSAEVKNRYNSKAYDRLNLVVPKGRKADIEAFAAERGQSINGFVGALIRREMGLSEDAWKDAQPDGEDE